MTSARSIAQPSREAELNSSVTIVVMTDKAQTYILPDPKHCKIPAPVTGKPWVRTKSDANSYTWSRDDGASWEMTLIFHNFEVSTNKYLSGRLVLEPEQDATPNDASWMEKYNGALNAFIDHRHCFEAWDEDTWRPIS